MRLPGSMLGMIAEPSRQLLCSVSELCSAGDLFL